MAVFKELRPLGQAERKQQQVWNDSCDTGFPYYGKKDSRNGKELNNLLDILRMYTSPEEVLKRTNQLDPIWSVQLELGAGGIVEAGFSNVTVDLYELKTVDRVRGNLHNQFKDRDIIGFISFNTYNTKKAVQEANNYFNN